MHCSRSKFALLSLLLAGWIGLPGVAGAQSIACTAPESDPVVEIVRSGPFNGIDADAYAQANYDDFIGTISNTNFRRFWDGTCGSYKVPVRIVAPKAAACDTGRLANVGLIELIHPFVIGNEDFPPGSFSGVSHGWNDPAYDPLLDHGSLEAWLNFQAPFLFGDPSHGGSGAIYVGFQAYNFEGQLDYIATLAENSEIGLHLERPQDYAVLYRDVSKWLRQPKTAGNFVNAGRSDLCPVSDVIGFGYSFTSHLLKAVLANPHRLNSTWGSADPIFPRARVMDGVLLPGLFGDYKHFQLCPDVTASGAGTIDCAGPDAASEGAMVVVRSEGDVQALWNLGLRPGASGRHVELDHFKVHEINSASHYGAIYFPMGPYLEYFGIDPTRTRENPLDRSPVIRADLVNLLNNIRTNAPLPESRFMEAHAPNSKLSIGIISLDPETGNGFGGIALPQAAAPLGLYRGVECHGPFTDPDSTNAYHYALPPLGNGDLRTGLARYILETAGASRYRICELAAAPEGIFTPYKTVDDALGSTFCENLYPTRQAYSDKVVAAADRLITDRLLLAEEREEIIAAAEAEADKYPECVPPR
jgi:hypothetical protein